MVENISIKGMEGLFLQRFLMDFSALAGYQWLDGVTRNGRVTELRFTTIPYEYASILA